jgi:hypothetical protein
MVVGQNSTTMMLAMHLQGNEVSGMFDHRNGLSLYSAAQSGGRHHTMKTRQTEGIVGSVAIF